MPHVPQLHHPAWDAKLTLDDRGPGYLFSEWTHVGSSSDVDGNARKLRSMRLQVYRGKRHVHEGKLVSLRRVKDNVQEVTSGNECGLGVEDFNEWREGDRIEALDLRSKRQTLEEASKSLISAGAES